MKSLPTNPDVIVVGAGAAGLAAALSLRREGLSTIVLEAAGRPGGRCITDTDTFSVPFDRGGQWLHAASINPLARLAEQSGRTLHKTEWDWTWVYALDRQLSDSEVADYRRYVDTMWNAIDVAGQGSQDTAIAPVVPAGPWSSTAVHSISHSLAADADETSARDVFNYANIGGDWLVAGGLGDFVAHLHRDVPVMCNCPVTEIDHTGPRIKVTTAKGTLEAENLVLTVSTGILAAETIRFVPQLPAAKLDAIDMLPNGLLNKVGIEFEPGWAGATQGQMADYHSGDAEYCSLHFGFYDTGLAISFVAGRFADQLERQGPGAATDYCLEALRCLFGNDIHKSIRRTEETAWRSNPFTVGSYSHARPGHADARKALAQSMDNRIFFAGEATTAGACATVHGAFLSGQSAARQILRVRG